MEKVVVNNLVKTFSENAEDRFDRKNNIELKSASKEDILKYAKSRLEFEESGLKRLVYVLDQATGGAFTDSNLGIVKFVENLFVSKQLVKVQEDFKKLEKEFEANKSLESLKSSLKEFQESADAYRKQRKDLTEIISLGVTTVAVVGVSLATSGVATPVIIFIFSTGASVGSEVLTKSILAGDAFDSIEAIKTIPTALINGAGMGIGNAVSKRVKINIAKSVFAKDLSSNLVQSVSGDFFAASVNTMPKVYQLRQEGKNIDEILKVYASLVGTQLLISAGTAVGFSVVANTGRKALRYLSDLNFPRPLREVDQLKLFKSDLLREQNEKSQLGKLKDAVVDYVNRKSRAGTLRSYRMYDEASLAKNSKKSLDSWAYWSTDLEAYAVCLNVRNRVLYGINEAAGKNTTLKVLDIGAGSGAQWLYPDMRHNPHLDLYLTSLTPNFHEMLKYNACIARAVDEKVLISSGSRAVVVDVLNLENRFRAGSFDLILTHLGMHGDEIAGLKRVHYLLREGGEAILTLAKNEHISFKKFKRKLEELLPDTFEVKQLVGKGYTFPNYIWTVVLKKKATSPSKVLVSEAVEEASANIFSRKFYPKKSAEELEKLLGIFKQRDQATLEKMPSNEINRWHFWCDPLIPPSSSTGAMLLGRIEKILEKDPRATIRILDVGVGSGKQWEYFFKYLEAKNKIDPRQIQIYATSLTDTFESSFKKLVGEVDENGVRRLIATDAASISKHFPEGYFNLVFSNHGCYGQEFDLIEGAYKLLKPGADSEVFIRSRVMDCLPDINPTVIANELSSMREGFFSLAGKFKPDSSSWIIHLKKITNSENT